MNVVILRDPDEALRFLLQALWFQRAMPPSPSTIKPILEWMLEIAASGQPLLPSGVVADFGHAAFGVDRDSTAATEYRTIPELPPTLMRTYEDHVLGKLYADWSFERASDALRRFTGRERAIGLAYAIRQLRDRGSLGGVEMSPGIIRTLLEGQPDELLRRGWDSLSTHGAMPLLIESYKALVVLARSTAEFLALEDVIALEQRTALSNLGQYVAHRQVLQTAHRLSESLPLRKIKPFAGRREVPTRILDEDTYPVGGFSSLSTKGSIESLLHSQLAFIEDDPNLRPDLFDVKLLRDELYYYSRDENQFLRRRRLFLFCLAPDLVQARFQDPDLPVQRIVMILAMLVAAVRKLSDWLSTDAIKFEFLIIQEAGSSPLAHEAALLEMLFLEQIQNHIVEVRPFREQVGPYADVRAQRTMCHLMTISTDGMDVQTKQAVTTQFMVAGPRPAVQIGYRPSEELVAEDTFECWGATLERLLATWV